MPLVRGAAWRPLRDCGLLMVLLDYVNGGYSYPSLIDVEPTEVAAG
jgi:hypothetical protein